MKLVRPIKRINTAKGHYYVDGVGTRVTGVTTVLDAMAKPALINWSATTTAAAAVDGWDELAKLKPAARLKKLEAARWEEKDRAAKRGTEIHTLSERLVRGEPVEVPDELVGYVQAYARFLDVFKVEPVHVEFGVASYRYAYAGTGDLIADVVIPRIGKKRLLLDLKSSRSGIFGETSLQLSAYRYADVLLHAGDEEDMPEVDDCAGVHIRGDAADLVPITTNEDIHRSFLYLAQVKKFMDISRDLVGAPIPPEAPSAYRLVRGETSRD